MENNDLEQWAFNNAPRVVKNSEDLFPGDESKLLYCFTADEMKAFETQANVEGAELERARLQEAVGRELRVESAYDVRTNEHKNVVFVDDVLQLLTDEEGKGTEEKEL